MLFMHLDQHWNAMRLNPVFEFDRFEKINFRALDVEFNETGTAKLRLRLKIGGLVSVF